MEGEDCMNKNATAALSATPAAGITEEPEQYLVFHCEDLLIGVRLDYVVETIINHSVTHLPMLPDYVCGVVNLRGEIVPIISARMRLGKCGGNEDCIIVLNISGMRFGILVDRVEQIVKIPKESIHPTPAQNTQELVCGMCSLPDGSTMLLLDCPELLET